MNNALKRGEEFLNYIGENQKELYNLFKKGVPYNPDNYNDCFNDSILKVYDTIIKNDAIIKDYKNYFFMTLKFTILQEIKKQKPNIDINDCKDILNEIDEDYIEYSTYKYSEIKKLVYQEFGKEDSDLFFDFMQKKYENGMSYSKYSEITGLKFQEIYKIISKIKKYLKSKEIKKIYNGLDL